MLATTLLIGVANILWAERLSINGGLGWDGQIYGGWAIHGFHSADDYYVHRILPSLVVRFGMQTLSVPLTTGNVIMAFEIYDLIALLIAVLAWGGIAAAIGVRTRASWFGYSCLFLGYVVLKSNFYQPVLTDTTAFTLALLVLYFYLIDLPLGLLGCAAVGAFSWPAVEYQALLLFLVPYRKQTGGSPSPWHGGKGLHWKALGAGVVLSLAPFLVVYGSLHDNLGSDPIGRYVDAWNLVDKSLLPISILAAVAYLLLGITTVLWDGHLFDFRRLLRSIALRRLPFAAALALAVHLLAAHLSNGLPPESTSRFMINYSVLVSIIRPLVFLVAHAVYFGPFVILTLLLLRRCCQELAQYGVALTMLALGTIIFSIDSQSRFLLTLAPIFVMGLAKIVDASSWRWSHYAGWAFLCVAYSKVWYVIHAGQQSLAGEASLYRFPLQGLFMNSGPWMSRTMYYVQGAAVLLTGVIIYIGFVPAISSVAGRNLMRRVPRIDQGELLRRHQEEPLPHHEHTGRA